MGINNIQIVKELRLEKQKFSLDTLQELMYLIPRKALARIQLLRKPKIGRKVLNNRVLPNMGRNQIPKDTTVLNKAISRVFVGAKSFEIFLPTLNEIHECARNLVFVNYAIPEGERWPNDGIEMLHKMELFSHRDFINAVAKFRSQVNLSKETNDFVIDFLVQYKNICGTFIDDIEALLINFDPKVKITYVPSIMEKERFHLLGLMLKMLCTLTQK